MEPIVPELNNEDTKPILVVDGKITNEEGPFRVKLSNSVRVDVMYYIDPVSNAEVKIFDDKGNMFQLYSTGSGMYESADKNLKGIPGNSYTLSITTPDGMEYQSNSVLMETVTEIDSLYFEEEIRSVKTDNKIKEENWLNILLDSHDSENRIKYWYYEFEETWEVKLLTDDVPVEHNSPGSPSNITLENVMVSADKQVCWVTRSSNSILIASTVNNPVNEIKRYTVHSLGPGEDKLHIRYSILVKQSTLSPELYKFWKLLKDVNENSGGLYEKMPAQIFGNISCCDGTSRALAILPHCLLLKNGSSSISQIMM
ncbi:MAG: DUF4249 domain-containing protein [Bacteroidales bacterium]|nr:DUF4249 domain-containing protein [Bacteroidales bacterium]